MPHEEHMHEDLEKEKDEAWENGNVLMAAIKKNAGFSGHVRKNKDRVNGAFPDKVSCICCMDGRVTADGVRVAGSGILLGPVARAVLIQQLKAAGITEVTRHPGCGAEELFIKDRMKHGLSRKEAEKEIVEWTERLKRELKATFREVPISSEFHNERAIYYDFTGTFNPSHAPDVFPSGFVISRKFPSDRAAIESVKIGITIATGGHGFGGRFNKKNPLTIFIIANNRAELAKARVELAGLSARNVKIEWFIKPKTK